MLVAGTVLLTLAIVCALLAIILTFCLNDPLYAFFVVPFILFGSISAIFLSDHFQSNPTDKDVFAGKAEYIEITHIIKQDTIKTYELKWKK